MNSLSHVCDLCGLPLHSRQVTLNAEKTFRFCCMGCRQVFQMLSAATPAGDPDRFKETELFQKCRQMGIIPRSEEDLKKRSEVPLKFSANEKTIDSSTPGTTLSLSLKIEDMWCPACAWVIEETLKTITGIHNPSCNFSTDRLLCEYDPVRTSPTVITDTIHKLGYRTEIPGDEASSGRRKKELVRFAVSAFLTMNVMMLSFSLYSGFFTELSPDTIYKLSWPTFIMAGIVLFYGGQNILRKARSGLTSAAFGMETLIAAGALSAYAYSTLNLFAGSIHLYYDTAAMLITLALLGKMLERRAKDKVQSDLENFFALKPTKIRICSENYPEGRYVSAEQLQKNDIFGVEAGEIIPADGLILEGKGTVDESALTGEPAPVNKKPGDRVRSGTAVRNGRFHVRAQAVGEDSTLGQMIRIMEKAVGEKTRLEGKTDPILQWFVPVIFILAAGTGLVWFLRTQSLSIGMIRAVTVMVISCPCALGIAVPLARVAGISAAGKKGILVRNFSAFENARKVDAVVFDKTGTVTDGRWSLKKILVFKPFTETDALALAAQLERTSEHYIAAEIRRYAENRISEKNAACRVEEIVCRENGVSARIDGKRVEIGSKNFLSRVPGFPDRMDAYGRKAGESAVFMSVDDKPCGVFVFGDTIRGGVSETVKILHSQGHLTALVSGDGDETTRAIGKKIGIQNAFGGRLPHEKAAYVEMLQKNGRSVAMVGDGINDAPALVRSDLSVAVHSGGHLGQEAADITLMRSDPAQILDFLSLAKRVTRKVRQNLWCALFYNVLSIPVAAGGLLTPLVAVSAMFMSSLTVIGNTLLLIRKESRSQQ